MFPENGKVKEDLNKLIVEDLRVREENACSTWNVTTTLELPWGVKEIVNEDYAEEVGNYFNEIMGSKIEIDSERTVEIIRGAVKERKGTFTLIFRYQLQSKSVAFSF